MKKIIQSFCIPVLMFLLKITSLTGMEHSSVQLKSESDSLIIDLSTSSSSSSSSNDANIHSHQDSNQSRESLQDDFGSPENKAPQLLENIVEQLIADGSKDPQTGRMLCTVFYLREQLIKLFTYEKISSSEELDSERYDNAYLMINTIYLKAIALLPLEVQQLLEELDQHFELSENSSSFKSFALIQASRHFFARKVYSLLHELENFYTLGLNVLTNKNIVKQMQSTEFVTCLNHINLSEQFVLFKYSSENFFSNKLDKYSFLDSKIIIPAFWLQCEAPIQCIFDLDDKVLESEMSSCQKISGLPDRVVSPEQKVYLHQLSSIMSSAQRLKYLLNECKQLWTRDKELWADLDTKSFINDFIDQTSGFKQAYAHVYDSVFEKIHASRVSNFSFNLSEWAKNWFAYFFINQDKQIQELPFSNKLPQKIFCIENVLSHSFIDQLEILRQAFDRNVFFVNQIINYHEQQERLSRFKSGKKSKKKSKSVVMVKSFEQNLHDLIYNHLAQNVTFNDKLDQSLYQAVIECDDLRCLLLSSGVILGKKYGENLSCYLRYRLSSLEEEVTEKDLVQLKSTSEKLRIDIGDNGFLRIPDLYTRVVHAYYLERIQDRIKQLVKSNAFAAEPKKTKKKKKKSSGQKKRSKMRIDKCSQDSQLPYPDAHDNLDSDIQNDSSIKDSSHSFIQEDSLVIVESELSTLKEQNDSVLDETVEKILIGDCQEEFAQSGKWVLVGKKKKCKKLSPYKKFIQSLQESLSISSDFFYSADEVIHSGYNCAIINQPPSSFNKQIGVVLYLQEKNQAPHIKHLKSYARIRKARNHILNKKDNFHDFSYRTEDYLEYGLLVASIEEAAHNQLCLSLKNFKLPQDCYAILIPGKLLCFNPNSLSAEERERVLDQNQPGEPGVFAGAFVFIFKKHDHTCVHRCFHQAKLVDQEADA